MSRVRGFQFRVYLEGVLLPAQPRAISIQMSFGSPASVTVSLPSFAFSVLQKIKPRTHVVVFVKDLDCSVEGDEGWTLVAEGEVRGYRMGKGAPGSHYSDLVIQTLDAYWSQTYAMQFTSTQMLFSSSGSDGKMVFGTGGNVTVVPLNQNAPLPVESDIQGLIKKSDAVFPELFADLLGYARKVNEFFGLADERLRIVDRLAYVPDEEIKKLTDAKKIGTLLNEVWSQYPENGRLDTILGAMMANVNYVYQSVANPSGFQTSTQGPVIRQFYLMPDLPFIAPPRCNTIFSGETSDWTFSRDILSEPTRARFVLPPVGSKTGRFFESYYSPVQMQEIAKRVSTPTPGSVTVDGYIMKGSGVPDGSREDVKGVIPLVDQFHTYDLTASGTRTPEDRQKYLSARVEYALFLEQHKQRTLGVSMPYNPNLMCGFTGLFLDPSMTTFGRISQIGHELVAEGAPTTRVMFDHCHSAPPFVDPPVWMNKAYVIAKRLDDTYEKLLGAGHKSVLAPMEAGGLFSGFATGQDAAKRLLSVYEAQEAKEVFASTYSARPIATLSQFFAFVKAKRAGPNFTGGPFRAEWIAAASDVAKELTALAQDVS